MTTKKGKIEIDFDEKGKIKKLSFGEDVSTSKIMEIINGIRNPENIPPIQQDNTPVNVQKNENVMFEDLSIKDKLIILLKKHFRHGRFTSKDLQEFYESKFGENVKISTISTYLTRMFEEGILDRSGSRKQREFRLISEDLLQTTPIQE